MAIDIELIGDDLKREIDSDNEHFACFSSSDLMREIANEPITVVSGDDLVLEMTNDNNPFAF